MDFSKCSYQCGLCGVRRENIPIAKGRPSCCGKSMDISNKVHFGFKVWNTDVATQTGEENARMCGIHI